MDRAQANISSWTEHMQRYDHGWSTGKGKIVNAGKGKFRGRGKIMDGEQAKVRSWTGHRQR